MAGRDDNSTLKRSLAPSKRDAKPPPAGGVSGRMVIAVVSGAVFGAVFAAIFAPGLALPLALGGALSFGAGAVALFLFASDEDESHGEAGKE